MKPLNCLIILTLSLIQSTTFSQWETNSIPYASSSTIYVSNPSFPNADIGYAVASYFDGNYINLKLFKSTNKSQSWSEIYNYTVNSNSNPGIFFYNINTGYTVTASTGGEPHTIFIHRTTNGGFNWSTIGNILNQNYSSVDHSIFFVNENIGYLWNTLNVFKTIDGGYSWNLIFNGPTYNIPIIYDVAISTTNNDIYIGADISGNPHSKPALAKSTNGGQTFTVIENGLNYNSPVHGIHSLSLVNSGVLYCGASNGLGKLENGQLVLLSNINDNSQNNWVSFTNENRGVMYSKRVGGNRISRTDDGGNSWNVNELEMGLGKVFGYSRIGDIIYATSHDPSIPVGQYSNFMLTRKIDLNLQYLFDNVPNTCNDGFNIEGYSYPTPAYLPFRGGTVNYYIPGPRIINNGEQIIYKWQNNHMNLTSSDYLIYIGSSISPNCKSKLKTTTANALSTASNVNAIKDTNGVINYLYESMGGIFYTRSTDNGSNFATEEIVNYHPTEYSGDGNYNPSLTEIKPYNLGQPHVTSSSNMAAVWERKENSDIKIRFSTRLYNSPPICWSAPIDLITLTNVPVNFKANPKIFMVKSTQYQDSLLCVLYLKPVNGINQLWVFGKGRGANNVNQCVISGNNISSFSAVSIMQNYMGNSLNLHIAYTQDGHIKYTHKLLTANEYGPYFETVNPDESYTITNNNSLTYRTNPDITLRNATNNINDIKMQPVITYQGRQVVRIINQNESNPITVNITQYPIVYRQRNISGSTLSWSGNGQYISTTEFRNPYIEGSKSNNSYILGFAQTGSQLFRVPLWNSSNTWTFNTLSLPLLDAKFVKGGLINSTSNSQKIITLSGTTPYDVGNQSLSVVTKREGPIDEVSGSITEDNIVYSFNLGSIMVNFSLIDFNFSIDSVIDDLSDFDEHMSSNPFYLRDYDTLVIGRNCFYVAPDTANGFSEIHYEVDLVSKTTNRVHSVLVKDTVHAEDTIQTEYLDGFVISGINNGSDSFYVKMIVDTSRVDGADGLDGSGISGGFGLGEGGDAMQLQRFINFRNLKLTNTEPRIFSLGQNYPNPFNPITKINYQLPKNAFVTITVYDILGREVCRLLNNEFKNAASYTVEWNAINYASGIYFYKIDAGEFVETKKMVLLK